jgi:hypothetical protein
MLALCSRDGIGFMESFFMNLLKVFLLCHDRYVRLEFTTRKTSVSEVCGTYNDVEEFGTHFVRFQGRESLSATCDGAATSVCCLTITTSVFLVFF